MHGAPRTWVNSPIRHHAVHSVDLFPWLTGDPEPEVTAPAGPPHPEPGCAMDVTIGLGARCGALTALACSFDSHGPFGGVCRHVCAYATWHVVRDELRGADRA